MALHDLMPSESPEEAEGHYARVRGGDEVLIDLGGYGLEITVADDEAHYDVRYVTLEYVREGGESVAKPTMLPADLVVTKTGDLDLHIPKGEAVRIWRHAE